MIVTTGEIALPHGLNMPGQTFLIGDVHGHAELLDEVFAWIGDNRSEAAEIIILGDMIHRGPESFRAIDVAWSGVEGCSMTLLPGNHEIGFLRFLSGVNAAFDRWINMGGAEMLTEIHDMGTMETYRNIRRKIRGRLPAGFEATMMANPGHVRRGDFIAVHAGVDPYVLDPQAYLDRGMAQGDPEWHWSAITNEFSDWKGGWDAYGAGAVVHGHQPILIPDFDEAFRASYQDLVIYRRLNLDFGCGIMDRRLGGAEIRNGRIRFFGAAG